MKPSEWVSVAGVLAFGAALGACGASASSASDDGSDPNAGGSGGSAGTLSAGTTGLGATGGAVGTGGSGGKLSLDAGPADAAPLTPDAACAAETFAAEPAPLNLMVMLDRSCSMTEPKTDPLWNKTRAGLEAFFSAPEAGDVGVALHYFPAPDTTEVSYCFGDEATPTVPLGKLSAAPGDPHEQKLIASMNAQTFNFGGTPMYQALYGALSYATVFANGHPDEQIVVVLVTDGVPGESCDYMLNNNIPGISKVAKFAYENVPSIRTFAIGLSGSQEQELTTVAQAGGGEAFFLGKSPNVTKDLFAKLEQIKQNNLGCTFKLPEAAPGKAADPKKVNVNVKGGGGDAALLKVLSKQDCVDGAWHYDDEAHPSKLVLCPTTCQQLKNDAQAKVEVLLGCASIVPK